MRIKKTAEDYKVPNIKVTIDYTGYRERKQEWKDDYRNGVCDIRETIQKKGFISGVKAW